ncbi:MAG: N-acetyl-1-D-myo-inositol-2-amino-2-deoxy-alpha-D-glucopyranoside deacetylase [Nocardioides sp.]|uniref:N-acetyl-1-D-myo-inositol-2-amino-2-deoxy-alpha- D-glucopyranoside deacetylase n=1 Tax=Nocardioides sp. TaxID=35761 RepID=UPI003EFEDD72
MGNRSDQRLLLVHAHPDDETIVSGVVMAKYVDEGAQVTLVTCTAGEMGEVLVDELSHLRADEQDALGPHRRDELAAAMKVLGVTDHRFLGGFGTYRDSGMQWHEAGHAIPDDREHHASFWGADLTEAATHLVEVIREVRPQVLVTYDDFGGYGHPDHVQAHRVAMYGSQLAAVPSYRPDLGEAHDVEKIYWGAISESRMRDGLRQLREAGDTESFGGMDPDGDFGRWVTPDRLLDARIAGEGLLERKLEALRQHRSQVSEDDFFFRGAESGGSHFAEEFFRLAKGARGPVGADGLEDDLFAGVTTP